MESSKKILIVSDACYPELTPRAFRTTELASELAREGYHVTLLIPNRQVFLECPLQQEGLKIIYADTPVEHAGGNSVARRNRSIRKLVPRFAQRIILYFYCHELFAKYNPGIYRRLMQLQEPFDAILSIAYPVAIHRAVTQALHKNPHLAGAVRIAEFSDPPFRGDVASSVFPAYNLFLKQWDKVFDYFTIPVKKALPCYTPYIDPKRIRIIPQGFDLDAIRIPPYVPNPKPTFAYAGRFYTQIRDPEFFFEFLKGVESDFQFELYINYLEPRFAEMIRDAQQYVHGKIILHDALPRETLIQRLATADFLINFDNTTAHATPSKLIDYAMTHRPVLSFNERTFRPEAFTAALHGNYSAQTELPDLSQYDIRNIAAQFLELIQRGPQHKK